MFNLIAIKDTVPVAPKAFGLDPALCIQDALNKKFANKLIPDRGLGLSVFDILTAEDGRVTWGNGQMYYKVSFRLMLFAPFVGEVIVGKVLSCTPSYIRITLGFFEDIYVPPSLLPPNSMYDENERRFFWYSGEQDLDATALANTLKSERFYYDPGEPIRFRVDTIEWHEHEPGPPVDRSQTTEEDEEKDPKEKAGYVILANVSEQGLGLTNWWDEAGDEYEEEAE
ncbi:hypothetical protein CC85DRAFT_284923 [Cutaneotrichosporon oleaginosum]|uniref:DNA-directed RNA polymerase III subunit RPC8 n=1 Tax=Cutaneotrichosporon oleaginosum TaxID=879819 RepID=A0A0J0XPC6_9TREE|nr:uncharacterized protein CC85DRAFT_284923 [Cutaneotrichosporon oleaginosum]KLT42966.1 hypothetical protein CC85DRAFT_284923 [Cutaneotrichosporon oleaginosum]TXT11825.1 hypothetical protein COLE_02235 [Cutaneotrichosporon oleaginosum]